MNTIRSKQCQDQKGHGCRKILQLNKYFSKPDQKHGVTSLCKKCYKAQYPTPYDPAKHRDPMRLSARKWRDGNREHYSTYQREYQRARYADPLHRKNQLDRHRMITSVHSHLAETNTYKNTYIKFELLTGCTIQEFIEYAEEIYLKRYGNKLDWDCWSQKVAQNQRLEVDHVINLKEFDTLDEDEHANAWHYTNLEIVSWFDNHRAGK